MRASFCVKSLADSTLEDEVHSPEVLEMDSLEYTLERDTWPRQWPLQQLWLGRQLRAWPKGQALGSSALLQNWQHTLVSLGSGGVWQLG